MMNKNKKGRKTIARGILNKVNNTPKGNPPFMLDRDQVFYSKAFRRLAGKAQVFVTGRDEHLRNRLTHTLEVSQIARSIGQALGLDLDLVEAIALGHDLGHTPFGHVGERTLHEIMTPHTDHMLGSGCPLHIEPNKIPGELEPFLGFKHNLQSIVVAMELEKNYGDSGLNLTPYTLYGIQAHSREAYKEGRMANHNMLEYYRDYLDKGCKRDGKWAWSLEAFLVAQADEIAQWHHDMEDAVLGGLITPKELMSLLKAYNIEIRKAYSLSDVEKEILDYPERFDTDVFIALFGRCMVKLLMDTLTRTADEKIRDLGGPAKVPFDGNLPGVVQKNAHTVALGEKEAAELEKTMEEKKLTEAQKAEEREKARINQAKEVFSFGDSKKEGTFAWSVKMFSDEIVSRVLSSCDIQRADAKGKYIIKKIFQAYYANPQQLPDSCVYDFLVKYHALESDARLKKQLRHTLEEKTEAQLRKRALEKGVGSIRRDFMDMFQNRGKTSQLEELLLMRTICNHIACMTDADAVKTYEELYG